jgi:hypothetical protein
LLGDDVDIAGDFDGDSIADLVIGAPGPDPYGAVYVASGTSSGTVAASSATHVFSFDLSLSNYVGMHDADLGDATGDGITDLAMATPREVPDPKVYLIEGGLPPGTYDVESAAWATVETTADNQETGPALAGGDYDGDGTVDLFAGRELGRGYVYAFLGPLSGELTAGDAATTWETTEPFADGLGTAIAVDHIDGDDQLDVLMGHDRSDGVAFVQLGWVEGVIDVTTLPGFAPPRGGYRNSLATIPDWSGDGGAEILIGTPFAGDDLEGAARVYLSDRL